MIYIVTPCVGVWIETLNTKDASSNIAVTPCVGVWIETDIKDGLYDKAKGVTPCVGVWIETMINAEQNAALTSHPAWVCGLKRNRRQVIDKRK